MAITFISHTGAHTLDLAALQGKLVDIARSAHSSPPWW
jgi:hypothetical protein